MVAKELFQALQKGNIAPVYLFGGSEKLLIEQAVEELKAALADPIMGDLGLTVLDGETQSPEALFEALETVSFFGGRKLVIIRSAPYFKSQQDKLTDLQKTRLEGYLAQPMEENCLVFIPEQTDKRKRVSKLLISSGGWVDFDRLDRPAFETWIGEELKRDGKTIGTADLKYLMEMTGYLDKNSERTLLEIRSDLERLTAYCGEKEKLERADIDIILQRPLDYNIFAMVDHVADGASGLALQMLHELLLDGEAEIKVLFMIARHFRILLRCRCLLDTGYTGKDMASRVGVAPFLIKKYTGQASVLGLARISKALEYCLETDRFAKTGRVDPKIGLEMLIVRLGEMGKGKAAS